MEVDSASSGQKAEKFVKKLLNEAPLSFIYRLFRKKDVKVNGHWVERDRALAEGDVIRVYVTDEQLQSFHRERELPSSALSSPIIYEDEHILIVNKPAGLLVVKDANDDFRTLSNQVLAYLSAKGEYNPSFATFAPSPAHRLDRNTSGLVLFGKDDASLKELTRLFREREGIKKSYLALCVGVFKGEGLIDKPLLKDAKTGLVRVSRSSEAKNAKTIYKTLTEYAGFTLVECELLTGRTHQIRVHMASIGHPLLGDAKYGDFKTNKAVAFPHQFLHAHKIAFERPQGILSYLQGRAFECPLPKEDIEFLSSLSAR